VFGRSFGTADGDYVVPERYGGTVYKRPSEKQPERRYDPPAEDPREDGQSDPARRGGSVRLSQKAAEMHEKDIRRITDTAEETGGVGDGTKRDAVPESDASLKQDAVPDAGKQDKKSLFPDISEEDLLIIGLIMLMIGGKTPQRETARQGTDTPGQADAASPGQDTAGGAGSRGDDVLIPLLLTLLIL